jgi:hypothetical protein
MLHSQNDRDLWRGDLSPLGCVAAPKAVIAEGPAHPCNFYDCCAAERGGATFR